MSRADDDLPHLREGDVLAGKYKVERVLGMGGMGVVVAAVHEALGQRVAIKLLRRGAANDASAVDRFLREARAVVRLKSEHAIRVHDVGTLDTGEPYMVMERLEGKDFGTILEEQTKLPAREAVAYVLQACEALAEAHAAGIIHRDLKPENLFLTTGVDRLPLVKVLDFGLVKNVTPESNDGLSLTGALVMGTPEYMSPEQIKSTRAVDARADIWSLGVVLFELVSGRLPFEAESLPDLVAAIVRDPAPLLSSVAPEAPPGLTAIVARCLEKDPAKRYPKIAKLAADLDPFSSTSGSGMRIALVQPSVLPPPTPALAWRPVAEGTSADGSAPTLAQPGASEPPVSTPGSARTRTRIAIGAALLVVVFCAALGLARAGSHAAVAPATTTTDTVDAPAASVPSLLPPENFEDEPNVSSASSRPSPVAPISSSSTNGRGGRGRHHGGKDAGIDEGDFLQTR